jgi:hypothetical protein
MAPKLDSFEKACLRADYERANKTAGNGGSQAFPVVLSSAMFVSVFVPPEYIIAGILQRRFIYSFTGATGAGKTAIMLFLAVHVALGRDISPQHEVERGRVLYLAGENPTDCQMRWIAMAQQFDFDPDEIEVHFIPGVFRISEARTFLETEIEAIDGVSLVLIDTSSAYFEGEDENHNKQAGDHARLLRSLTTLPGGPCVVVACHPPKNATETNLQPRGGGAFIAEMDGNLTAKNDDGSVEFHWQGKFRGPDFAPISFELRQVTHQQLKDQRDRLLPTIIARHLSDSAKEDVAKAKDASTIELLKLIARNPKATLTELALMLNWKMKDGTAYKMRVKRCLTDLAADKLIRRRLRKWELTKDGEKVAAEG